MPIPTMIRIVNMTRATATEIHSGERTHHHDHVIYPVSFNPINSTVSRPVNPNPLLLLLDSLIACTLFQLTTIQHQVNNKPVEVCDPSILIQVFEPVSSLVYGWRALKQPGSIPMVPMSHRDNIGLLIDSGGNHWVIGTVVSCMLRTSKLRYLWKWHASLR